MSERTRKRATRVARRKPRKRTAPSLQRRLDDALARAAASAEILSSIRNSTQSAQPVFDAIVRNLQRLFGTAFAAVFLAGDGKIEIVAAAGKARFDAGMRAGGPMRLEDEELLAVRAMRRAQVLRLCPVIGNPDAPSETERLARKTGINSVIAAPMLRDGVAIGAIATARIEAVPFDDAQVGLIQSFADQAVIAIENARLFNETKESLERETATAEILRVMSSSPSDVQSVFDAVARKTSELCNGNYAIVVRFDGELIHLAAQHNARPGAGQPTAQFYPRRPGRETPSSRSVLERAVVHIPYADKDPHLPQDLFRRVGAGSFLSVPLLRDGKAIGAIGVSRAEAGPFPARQIELVKLFADQAMIAIENARLFNETKEALQRQTATAEILGAISGSPTDIQPVFDIIAERAVALCGGEVSVVSRFDGAFLQLASIHGITRKGVEALRDVFPLRQDTETLTARAFRGRSVVHVPDVQADPRYEQKVTAVAAGWRSGLAVPMLRGTEGIGVIFVGRSTAGLFTESQVELLKTFADQAVIAIENVRLFNETEEALEQQTAISEILRVISDSPTNVQPVLEAVAARAARICDATDARIFVVDGPSLRHAAGFGDVPTAVNVGDALPLDRGSSMGRAVIDRAPVHVEDMQARSEDDYPFGRKVARQAGWRTVLAVPLLREGRALGGILLRRMEVRPFSDKQIALLKTFADQAAIAMENVRLFNETKEALEHQKASSGILRVVSSSIADAAPVFEAIADSCAQIFQSEQIGINLLGEDGAIHLGAYRGRNRQDYIEWMRSGPTRQGGKVLKLRHAVAHFPDVEGGADVPDAIRQGCRITGSRSIVFAPMISAGHGIGAVFVGRDRVGPFSEKEIALLTTFCEQAVIAIQNARLFNQTKQALEKQTATAEILGVISGTPTDTQPVFEAIVRRATKLCEAAYANVFRYDGEQVHWVTSDGWPPDLLSALQNAYPARPDRSRAVGRVILDKKPVHVEDTRSDPDYDPDLASKLRYRRILAVPLLRAGEVVGVITVGWAEPGPIEPRHDELLKTFAAQAVIAIENVRLFNETKEALEQQTAISEVLRVISSSPADVQPVLDAVAERAARICDAIDAQIFLREGNHMTHVARFGTMPIGVELGHARPLTRGWVAGRAVLEARAIHIDDLLAVPREEYPLSHELRDRAGHRTLLSVPLMRERRALGAISLRRMDVRPFTEKQIALLRTFADQAAIAIENVRLFNETRESLERQTATAEVLKTISRSTFELNTVLQALLDNAARLGGAEQGVMLRPDAAGNYLPAFAYNWSEAMLERLRERPIRPGRDSTNGRVLLERRPIHISDVLADPEYGRKDLISIGGFRAVLAVPMLRDGEAIGLISLSSKAPFTEKQMEVVTSFADQAVIAIENVRLFNETKEALDQQKASADVLGVISSSIADTSPVFEKILDSCQRLFAGRTVGISVAGDDGQIHLGAYKGYGRAEFEAHFPVPLSMESGSGAAILQRQVVHYPDCEAPDVPEYARVAGKLTGNKSLFFAPMLWEGKGVGAIFVGRPVTGPFTDKEIALLRTFADQAAIAIQNAKLFREIQEKSAQLEVANKHKSDFLANMSHELRTPLNAIIGFSEALIDRMFGELNEKQGEYLKDIHESGRHLLSLINDILDLSKIEAGRMELDVSTFDLPSALSNAITLVRERAQRHAIDLALEVDKALGAFSGDERKFKQIMLNLLSNAVKFTPDGGRIAVCARKDTTHVEISVQDTGIGIAPEDQAAVFEEFRQVGRDRLKKAEGTGLGLALTKRFVELHGGEIRLDSAPGKGSTFTVSLPLRQ